MEFNTQGLGILVTLLFLMFCGYKYYKTENKNYLISSGILIFIVLVYTFIYSPVKQTSPKMQTIEWNEKTEIVIPEKVVIEKESLEDSQNKLINKVEK